jgi:hypothetical protein
MTGGFPTSVSRWVRAATVAHGRQRQSKLELEVRILQVALAGLVTKFQLVHLQKLASDGPAVVRFGNIMLDELIKLDAMQFLRPIDPRGWNALRDDHGSGLDDFDTKQYIEITEEGREYLALRTELAARLAELTATGPTSLTTTRWTTAPPR